MPPTSSFTAILAHTRGGGRGRRERFELPLHVGGPPDVLRRPANVGGRPSYEVWGVASLDEWTAAHRVAIYTFSGYVHRDPNVRPEYGTGTTLPWAS